MMRRLPLAYHCDRRWAEMKGDAIVRHCQGCSRDVVNLSALDEPTARAMLDGQTTTACVRYRHERGRIVFARRVRELAIAAAAAVLLGTTPATADTTTPQPPHPQHPAPVPRRPKHSGDGKHTPPAPKTDDSAEGGVILAPTF